MQCHYCDRPAVTAPEYEGIHVGLCEEHFREQMDELADSDEFAQLKDELGLDR